MNPYASSFLARAIDAVITPTEATWRRIAADGLVAVVVFEPHGEAAEPLHNLGWGGESCFALNQDIARRTAAGSGWAAQLEYVSAVDGQGRPTRWSTLTTLTNTTNGLRKDGQITFDPPRDWAAATINGSAKLYYARFKTTGTGSKNVCACSTVIDSTSWMLRPLYWISSVSRL